MRIGEHRLLGWRDLHGWNDYTDADVEHRLTQINTDYTDYKAVKS